MGHGLPARTPDGAVVVDGRDVAAWGGTTLTPDPDDDAWRERAQRYVDAHPRRDSKGIAAAQRLALLRRLAAGPATRAELLAALRSCGWVGASDLENRLRDLRAADRRAGPAQAGLPLRSDGERYWLAEPFPALDADDVRALGFAKAMIGQLDGPLAAAAAAALDHLLPGLAPQGSHRRATQARARARDYQRFEAARLERRGVRVRYFSLNSGAERTYTLVPVEYVTLGATVKAVCVRVGPDGRRADDIDRQFALDRLLAVEELPEQPPTPPEDLELRRWPIVLQVSDVLYQVLRARDVFGLGEVEGVQDPFDQSWRVEGVFPEALAWDVMEQLCAWAGQAQVHEPLWLVNAVVRRLRAGLRAMDEGAAFELVKPETRREFRDLGEAIRADAPLPPPRGPRKLAPPAARR